MSESYKILQHLQDPARGSLRRFQQPWQRWSHPQNAPDLLRLQDGRPRCRHRPHQGQEPVGDAHGSRSFSG